MFELIEWAKGILIELGKVISTISNVLFFGSLLIVCGWLCLLSYRKVLAYLKERMRKGKDET